MGGMHLVFLLLALIASSSSAKVFLSLDCGASGTFTDENTIKWTSDDDYIKTGESHMVASIHSISNVMDTLRVFTTGTKNCYSIKVDKGERVLVRASFNYGYYDNRLLGPTFDLELNGNHWATVTSHLPDGYIYFETIYVVDGGEVSVCLVQTSAGEFPFISALEVRSLDANMYSRVDSNRPLYMIRRAFGSDSEFVRYPDDIYDRIWSHTFGSTPTSNPSLAIDVKTAEDNPPQAALRHAVTSSITTLPVEFYVPELPITEELPVYINMYFAELDVLDSTDKRSFDVYMGNKRVNSAPISPPYGSVMELHIPNMTASYSTVFHLKATPDSTLPPIINAFELFHIGDDFNNNNNNNNRNNDSGSDSDNNNRNNKHEHSTTGGGGSSSSNSSTIYGGISSVFLIIWAITGILLIYHYKKKTALILGQAGTAVTPNDTPNSTHHIMRNANNRSAV